jgi:hypothetical protein
MLRTLFALALATAAIDTSLLANEKVQPPAQPASADAPNAADNSRGRRSATTSKQPAADQQTPIAQNTVAKKKRAAQEPVDTTELLDDLEDYGAGCNTCGDTCGDRCGDADGRGCGSCGLLGGCGPWRCRCQPSWSPSDWLTTPAGSTRFYGWLNAGGIINTGDPSSGFNGPYNQIDNNGGMFNQGYFVAERALKSDDGISLGGRFDVLFGNDFLLAQSSGLEAERDFSLGWNNQYYGLALPQMYGQIGNRDFSLKVGHFYTVVGYEGVPAPVNFFYSKAYSYMFAGPFTHWGALASWNLTDRFTVDGGVVNGWNALDRTVNQAAFMGRARLTGEDPRDWSAFSVITGNEDTRIPQFGAKNRTRYSALWNMQLTDRFQYLFHHWLGFQGDALANGKNALWYGLDQYVFYPLNDCWKLGFRFEWFRDEQGVRVGLNRPSNPNKPPFQGSFYSASFGLNYSRTPNFIIRPELRFDFYEGKNKPFDDGIAVNQLMLGGDMIWMF